MSWDVLLIRLPEGTQSIGELSNDFEAQPLGDRAALIATIQAAVPDVDFSDRSWGLLIRDTFSIELNVGDESPVDTVMLHVRGGDEALPAVQRLAETLRAAAFDCSSGDLIDFSSPSAGDGFKAWRGFRNRVIGDDPTSSS
jgi:hypothetical protein